MDHLRSRRDVVVVALLLGLVSCTEPVAPVPVPTIAVAISRSADWFAYRNDGGNWTTLAPAPSGSYEFLATPKVAIAWVVNQPGNVQSLTVQFQTADSYLQETARAARSHATLRLGTGVASGVALGIPPGPFYVSIGHGPTPESSTGAYVLRTDFSLQTWSVPMDLIATMVAVVDSTRDIVLGVRGIMRRGERLSPGAAITLDFSSAEVFPLGTTTLLWTGPDLGIQVDFISATGSQAQLSQVAGTTADQALMARRRVITRVPADRLIPGDLYMLSYSHPLSHGEGSVGTTRWTRTLSDSVLDIGVEPAAPTITQAPPGDDRPHFVIPARAEFGNYVIGSAERRSVVGGIVTLHRVAVLLSKGYLGATPDVWTLEMPDLTHVPGFPAAVAFPRGGFSWTVIAYGGNCAQCADSTFDGRIERTWVVSDTVR